MDLDMDIKALDKALQEIVKKRNELHALKYNDPKYDDLEEELHDLEDDFQGEYGEYMEEILQDVHDEICPDTEVLYPIAYIAKSYAVKGDEYKVELTDGVYVEVDKYPGKETKLALIPNPIRVLLNVGKEKQEVVWSAK